jgi:hypothetical protein
MEYTEKVSLDSLRSSETTIEDEALFRLFQAYHDQSNETPRDVVRSLYAIAYNKGAVEQREFSEKTTGDERAVELAFMRGERVGLIEAEKMVADAVRDVLGKGV